MRWLLTGVLFISFTSVGQDCKTLNNLKGFHGVKFGKPFPDSLKKYFEIAGNQQTDTTFDLYNSTIENKPTYNKLSTFLLLGDYFEATSFFISNGKVYSVMLVKEMNSEDSAYTASNKHPVFLKNVSEELVSMFGKPTRNGIEDVLWGKALIQSWECEKVKIVFEFKYTGVTPLYSLSITDINLEKIQKIKKLSD